MIDLEWKKSSEISKTWGARRIVELTASWASIVRHSPTPTPMPIQAPTSGPNFVPAYIFLIVSAGCKGDETEAVQEKTGD